MKNQFQYINCCISIVISLGFIIQVLKHLSLSINQETL